MVQPFRVRDGDAPGADLGGWDEAGNIDLPGTVQSGGVAQAAGIRLPIGEHGPQDHGYETWSGNPFYGNSGTALTNGTIYLQRLMIRRTFTPTRLTVSVTSAAVTPTAGQSEVGLYSRLGARLTAVNVDTALTGTGTVDIAVTPGQLTAGTFVWAAVVGNAATPAQLLRFSGFASSPSAGLPTAELRSCVNGTGATSLPASLTLASNSTTGNITYWVALT